MKMFQPIQKNQSFQKQPSIKPTSNTSFKNKVVNSNASFKNKVVNNNNTLIGSNKNVSFIP